MALYYDLNVFKDVYKLILIVFEVTKEFPREYKYTLGQDIHPVKSNSVGAEQFNRVKRDAIQLVRSIYRANKAKFNPD